MSLDFINGTKNGQSFGSYAAFLAAIGSFARPGASAYDLAMAQLYAADVPRVSALGLLIEPQSTNLALQSSFASVWSQDGLTLTPNAFNGPTGVNNAAKLGENAAVGVAHQTGYYNVPATLPAGRQIVHSLAAKRGGGTRDLQLLMFASDFSINWGDKFNLATGIGPGNIGTGVTNRFSYSQALANGYLRLSTSGIRSSGADTGFTSLLSMVQNSDGAVAYDGNGTSAVAAFGLQVEIGQVAGYFNARPTSYIPTTTAALTRGADDLKINVPAGYNTASVTFDDGSTQLVSVTGGGLWSVPVNLNRPIIKTIDFRVETDLILKTEGQNYGKGTAASYMGMWYKGADPTFNEGDEFNCSAEISVGKFPADTIIRSKVPMVQSPSGIYGYLHIDRGNYDGSPIQTAITPKQSGAISQFYTDIDFDMEGDGYSSVLHELWYGAAAAAFGGFTKVGELGCLPWIKARAIGYLDSNIIGSLTDTSGRTWKLGQQAGSGGPYYMFALASNGPLKKGRIPWGEFNNKLLQMGKLNGTEWINGVAIGPEPDRGFDKFTLRQFDLTLA